MPDIRKIPTTETFIVRHPVLRNGKPVESCKFDGDDLKTTTHFGYFQEDNLVGVISVFKVKNKLFIDENQFQIRGMAILEQCQKKGFGEALIKQAESYVAKNNETLIWFNARVAAIGFYEKLGYQIIGNSFDIGDIGKHFVLFKKIPFQDAKFS